MAGAVLTAISKDEHERAKFMSRRKAETDRVSNLLTVQTRTAMEIALEMKADDVPAETIARYTKLSISDIESL